MMNKDDKKDMKIIVFILLGLLLGLFIGLRSCDKNNPVGDYRIKEYQKENIKTDMKIKKYKSSVDSIDISIDDLKRTGDSISEVNRNISKRYKEKIKTPLNGNRDKTIEDTLIDNLNYTIEIKDTTIDRLETKDLFKDGIIDQLEVKVVNMESISHIQGKELKEIKRKNTWKGIIISILGVAVGIILIVLLLI